MLRAAVESPKLASSEAHLVAAAAPRETLQSQAPDMLVRSQTRPTKLLQTSNQVALVLTRGRPRQSRGAGCGLI